MKNKLHISLILLFFVHISLAQRSELDSLKNMLNLQTADSIHFDLLQKISKIYAPKSFDSAYYYGKKSLEFAKNLHKDEFIIDAYTKIGLAFDYQSKIDSTLFWYQKALNLAKKTHNKQQLVKIYNHIGVAYYFNTKYDESIKSYYKSLQYSREINDSVGIARCYNNIGLIHEKQKNYDNAIKFYKKSLAIKENFKSIEGLIYPLTNLSNISIINNDFENGLKYMKRTLAISIKLKDTTMIAMNYSNMARIYAKNKQIKRSGYYLQKSLALLDKIEDKFEYSQLLFDLGVTYEKLGAYREAEKSFLKAISISEKIKKRELLEKAYKSLSDLYRVKNEYKKSLYYYDKYTATKDSFFTVDKHRAVSEIETKYETAKKEKEINSLKANVIKEKLNQKFWAWVSFLSILLATTFIYFFYNSRKKSLELIKKNEIIQKTLAEKNVLFKEVHHRVKNNLQVISSILSLQIRYLKEPIAIEALKDSQRRIDSISLIHQKLYKKDNITGINMKDFIDDLVYNIIESMRIDNSLIEYRSEIDQNLVLEVDTVTPLGLILNELIINSLKHNNNKKDLKLIISLKKENNLLVLRVKDNGKGISDNFDYLKKDSYGMKMIASLSKKLKAKIQFINQKGLLVHIEIHKYKEIEG